MEVSMATKRAKEVIAEKKSVLLLLCFMIEKWAYRLDLIGNSTQISFPFNL